MPMLTKAMIYFPKWGLYENKALAPLIKTELYSEFAKFTIPDDEDGICEVFEQACYARFGIIEQALRSHHIPYDVVFQLKGNEVKTKRSWRPGMGIDEDREFPVLDEAMVSAKRLSELTKAYPEAVPSHLINNLVSKASYPVSELSDWPEAGLSPIETDESSHQALSEIINSYSMFDDVAQLIKQAKEDEAQRLISEDMRSQIRYLADVMGLSTLKRKLSEAFKARPHNDNKSQFKP